MVIQAIQGGPWSHFILLNSYGLSYLHAMCSVVYYGVSGGGENSCKEETNCFLNHSPPFLISQVTNLRCLQFCQIFLEIFSLEAGLKKSFVWYIIKKFHLSISYSACLKDY